MRWLFALMGTLSIGLAACGGSQSENDQAAATIKQNLAYTDTGQWRRQYDTLHPAQQAIIPFDLYESCRRKAVQGISEIKVDRVIEVFDEETAISGTDQRVPSKAVTIEYSVKAGGTRQTMKSTVHAVKVGDGWRTIASDAGAYREGHCPN